MLGALLSAEGQRNHTHLKSPVQAVNLAFCPSSMASLCLNHQQDFAMSDAVTLEVFTDYV
ncbi:MAG: hypothetical protein ACI9DC_003751 [Gammaproteobacteria bacterium]